ncbi:MAG: heme exporter protein CcmB [Gammaproteobacteria bacterium]|nr:heme exporter protein CcmB [Gammaproteobacteria bacterium]MCZ6773922.1 heme exporter protein CcmB [Pseudomonadota bacterium]
MRRAAHALKTVIGRDLLRTARSQTEAVYPLIFFALCVLMFPFAIGTDIGFLERIAPGVLWVSALLAATLSLENLFRGDYQEGTLELMVVSDAPLVLIGLGKSFAHWLLSGLPIVLMAVPLGLVLAIDLDTLLIVVSSLLLGTLTMSLVGAAISALTVGLRGGGMLLALLILPLYIPILIFGAAAAGNAARGLPADAELYFLAGLMILAVTLAPWATAAAMRIRMS